MLQLSKDLKITKDTGSEPNLCKYFDKEDLKKIASYVYDGYETDLVSREPWERRMEAAMDLAMQVQKTKSFPWPGAANVIFPLITIASLQFSARAYGRLIQGTDVVKYRVVGDDVDGKLTARADRISNHMSWQMLEEDSSWEEQHDLLLINLSIVGCNFIKSWRNSTKGHNSNDLVLARNLIVNYWTKSLSDAPRITHILPLKRNVIVERVRTGTYVDVCEEAWFKNGTSQPILTNDRQQNRNGVVQPYKTDTTTPYFALEQHVDLDLDCDGYAEPYIVTIEAESRQMLRLVANWEREEDVERNSADEILKIHKTEYFTKYSFIPAPDGGFYDLGFGILLGPLNESVDTAINQLLDAGTMANSNGGFLGRGAKFRGGKMTFAPWEWARVDSTGDDLRKNMVPMPTKEPSNVMFALLGLLIEYTDRVSGATDTNVGVSPGQNTPAETSRNTHESGMQVYSTIFRRVWRSMREEFQKCHKLNARYLEGRKVFGSPRMTVSAEDYKSSPEQVVPVADPNITSAGMRFQQAHAIAERASMVPGYNPDAVERNFLRALRVENVNELYPGIEKIPPGKSEKISIQEMKNQLEMEKIKWEREKFIQELREAYRLNSAKIAALEADAMVAIVGATVQEQAAKLEVFNTHIQAYKTHNDVIDSRIKTLTDAMGAQTDDKSGGGGSGGGGAAAGAGVAAIAGNAISSPTAQEMGGGDQGAVGIGDLSSRTL